MTAYDIRMASICIAKGFKIAHRQGGADAVREAARRWLQLSEALPGRERRASDLILESAFRFADMRDLMEEFFPWAPR